MTAEVRHGVIAASWCDDYAGCIRRKTVKRGRVSPLGVAPREPVGAVVRCKRFLGCARGDNRKGGRLNALGEEMGMVPRGLDVSRNSMPRPGRADSVRSGTGLRVGGCWWGGGCGSRTGGSWCNRPSLSSIWRKPSLPRRTQSLDGSVEKVDSQQSDRAGLVLVEEGEAVKSPSWRGPRPVLASTWCYGWDTIFAYRTVAAPWQ